MNNSFGKPRSRFWEHLSFCVTLFWALRRAKHLRAGQLIDNAIYDEAQDVADSKVIRDALARADASAARRARFLFNVEDEKLSFLLEEWIRRFVAK